MIKFLGVEYSRGATAIIRDNEGPALASKTVKQMFPNHDWNIIHSDKVDLDVCRQDRFGDALQIHKKIYTETPKEKHIFIGGDHSVNFSHFAKIADLYSDEDLCLIYIDAHLDIHTPESSKLEATGSPHGTNVRHLLGYGDKRWLAIEQKCPALKPENLFYLGTRAFEPSEIQFVKENNIFYKTPQQLQNKSDIDSAISEIRKKIGNKQFVVSFDFDAINPTEFSDVWVPEPNGISVNTAKYFVKQFSDALNFEFVEYAVSGNQKMYNIAKDIINIIVQTHD